MKKLLTILLFLGIFGLTGCVNYKNEFDIGNESEIEIVQNGVKLSFKENTLSPTGATLVLKNDMDVDIQYGNPYEIEIKKDGEWRKINVELNFTLPAFSLKAKETVELNLNWKNGYGKLSSGNYRIIKQISIEKEDGTFENFYVSVEFNI
ncbi:MAG: hypothetical protein E7164_04835 [Firmicutes bacterium]|nr:hypothetical protein [Bacillota bacterium]